MGAGAEIKAPRSSTSLSTRMLKALLNGSGPGWGEHPSATGRSFLCLRTKFLMLKKKGYCGNEDAEVVDTLLMVSRDD